MLRPYRTSDQTDFQDNLMRRILTLWSVLIVLAAPLLAVAQQSPDETTRPRRAARPMPERLQGGDAEVQEEEEEEEAEPTETASAEQPVSKNYTTGDRLTAEFAYGLGGGLGGTLGGGFLGLFAGGGVGSLDAIVPMILGGFIGLGTGTAIGVQLGGNASGGDGHWLATTLGTTAGLAGGVLIGAYLADEFDNPWLTTTTLFTLPIFGGMFGYEVSHSANTSVATRVQPTVQVTPDQSGAVLGIGGRF